LIAWRARPNANAFSGTGCVITLPVAGDLDGRHQLRVTADEHTIPDVRLVFSFSHRNYW